MSTDTNRSCVSHSDPNRKFVLPIHDSRKALHLLQMESKSDSVFLPLHKPNPNPLPRLQHNLGLQTWIPTIHHPHEILHALKSLQQPHNRIAHLRESELLANANTRATIKRNICPRFRLPCLPALRDKVENRDRGR